MPRKIWRVRLAAPHGACKRSIGMRYHVLASDYDGTLATHGKLHEETRAALERVRASGRKVVMVTGRQVDDLLSTCPDLSPFEVVVAENGAVLYWPASKEQRVLAEPPPAAFVDRLRAQGVNDIALGAVIVATWHPHETVALEAIRELGLELQVIFNKGAVMILPSGVNKATGLTQALAVLGFSAHEAVGVGDAENDHAFLNLCECAVAVENALPTLKDRADLVTRGARGAGVEELIERLLANDLMDLAPALGRHDIPIGSDANEVREVLPAYGSTFLVAGTSGGGKSTLITAFVEQLNERGYQFCIIDPEGDYGSLPGTAVVGDRQSAPTVNEVLKLLEQPRPSLVVNLVSMGIENRPAFFESLMPQLIALKQRMARPHFVIVDETHHLAPRDASPRAGNASDWVNTVFVTVHPKHVAPSLLQRVDVMIAIGQAPAETLAEFAQAVDETPPEVNQQPLASGEAIVWRRRQGKASRIRTITPVTERKRHIRKYATGDLDDHSFFFRGPQQKMNLKAQNLTLFMQLGDGVDDETWLHHLESGDYSDWMRTCIKDDELADEVASVEKRAERITPAESRAAVREAIERRYTAPE
jgi:HAD superfamily hydrolase (TIGR01484 family)